MSLVYSVTIDSTFPLPRAVKLAASYGYAGVESDGKGDVLLPSLSKREREEIVLLLDGSGIGIVCMDVSSWLEPYGTRFPREQEDDFLAFIELAFDLNCGFIRLSAESFLHGDQPEKTIDALAGLLHTVTESADGSGVKILLETDDAFPSGTALKSFLTRFENSEVAGLWNLTRTFRNGESIEFTADVLDGMISHIRMQDEYFDSEGNIVRSLPGQGVMPLAACRELMSGRGYTGAYSLVCDVQGPDTAALESEISEFSTVMR